jgi:hypothetical protein
VHPLVSEVTLIVNHRALAIPVLNGLSGAQRDW